MNFKQKFMTKPKESVFYKSETTKHSMNSSCTLKLSCETEKKKKEINERLKKLVKNYITTPEKLLQYMQLQGMKVYKFKNASKLLKCLKEEEGFLTPLKGYKAIILNLIIGCVFEKKLKLSFTTNAMFIFNLDNMEIYTIARALHKYYGFKNNLPGFDFKSQEIFKKVYNSSKKTSAPFSQCRINDLYACKEAIARDLDSINFTIDLSVEYERSLDVLKKMKETSATI